jgi:hypothetical protein
MNIRKPYFFGMLSGIGLSIIWVSAAYLHGNPNRPLLIIGGGLLLGIGNFLNGQEKRGKP